MTFLALALALSFAALPIWRRRRARAQAERRLDQYLGSGERTPETRRGRRIRPYPPRRRFVGPAVGVAATAALWAGARLPLAVAGALGLLVGVLASLVEEQWRQRQADRIEAQLASAIYLMMGSLRAGASLLAAFDSALEEVGSPLRTYFQEVATRIRLGDDPRVAVGDLERSIPLETFRLFSTSLATHWEVGGSLATTLSAVGQTVRDRIELGRRVRAQGVESQASVAVVLGIAYVLAFLMWRTSPERLEAFVASGVGTTIISGVIALQAIGLIWMARLSRSTF